MTDAASEPDPDEEAPIRTRRILSIDGGGIRGVEPAAFLAALEADLEHPIGSYFDLIAGTSTGGILAIGLALGMRAADLLALYEKQGPAIFRQEQQFGPVRRRIQDAWRKVAIQSWRPKHKSGHLRAELERVLGSRRIGEHGGEGR